MPVVSYEAVVWVIENGSPVEKCGMKSYQYMRVTNFAYAAREVWRNEAPEGGYITITDASDGRELDRVSFFKAKAATAAY